MDRGVELGLARELGILDADGVSLAVSFQFSPLNLRARLGKGGNCRLA